MIQKTRKIVKTPDFNAPWHYNNAPITDDMIPEWALGFIYRIVNTKTGRIYIGRKMLYRQVTKTVKKRKRKVKVESDWKTYYGSSPTLLEDVASLGKQHFTREILSFAPSKGSLLYAEELALYLSGALENDLYYNNNIRSKIYRSWIQNKMDTAELRNKL